MEPSITVLPETRLIGQRLSMSLNQDRTFQLFRGFMPRRREITNVLNSDVFCMRVHTTLQQYEHFDFDSLFDKWAAVPVTDHTFVPPGMEAYTIRGGLYAVFLYRGRPSEGERMFRYIFTQWLPASAYELDLREHFDILGEKYRPDDPESEEELWIPIRQKTASAI